jgi:hypothetical protein
MKRLIERLQKPTLPKPKNLVMEELRAKSTSETVRRFVQMLRESERAPAE